jgi:hypothetical protein
MDVSILFQSVVEQILNILFLIILYAIQDYILYAIQFTIFNIKTDRGSQMLFLSQKSLRNSWKLEKIKI